MEEVNNIDNNVNKLSKNKKLLILILACVVIALVLIILMPRDKGTAVKDLNLDSQLTKSKATQFLGSTKKSSSSIANIPSSNLEISSEYIGDYYLDSDSNLHLLKENGEDVVIANGIGANSGFKLDIAKQRLFYRSGMNGTIVDLKTGEKTTTEGLLNTWFTKDYTLFSVVKDGKDYLMLGDSTTPIMEGNCIVVNVLNGNTIAVLDVDPELNYPMPGYTEYDSKQETTNLNLVKIDLDNISKTYSPIVLANSDRGSVNLAGNIIYQDNNNKTKINNGERELTVNIPINISTLSLIGGTNTALFAEVSRAENRINVKSLNLDDAKVTNLNEYYFKDSIYTVPSEVPDSLKDALATPISKLGFDSSSNNYTISVGDNLINLPASSNPVNKTAFKTNILSELATNFGVNSNNNTDTNTEISSNQSNQVLGEESSTIPSECKEYVNQINKDTEEQEARDKLDQALKCFGGYSDTVVQSQDIRTLPEVDSDGTVRVLSTSPEVISNLIKLIRQGKSFQIAKLANQFNAKDKLQFQAMGTIRFNREKTNFSLSDIYNDNIKVNNFFDNRLKFNLIDYARSIEIDKLSNGGSNVALAGVSGPYPCNLPSGQCMDDDGIVTDASDPTLSCRGTSTRVVDEKYYAEANFRSVTILSINCNGPVGKSTPTPPVPTIPTDPNPSIPPVPTVITPDNTVPTNPTNDSQSGPNV